MIQANTMNDGTTVAKIADMSNLIFKGKVDETEVGLLRTGMDTEISIGALPEVKPGAVIEYIAPKSTEDNGSNTFEMKAALDVPEGVQSVSYTHLLRLLHHVLKKNPDNELFRDFAPALQAFKKALKEKGDC